MTPLATLLRQRILTQGPITVADWMATALGHPQHGYYQTRDPFGRAGDFVTAPEISQIFGELIGLWCAELWLRHGRPAPVRLVELGPGRGTLAADLWRAAGVVPGFRDALDLHLVETSPVLRRAQAECLAAAGAPTPRWADRLADVPGGPSLVIANEFFDALPIHQLVAVDGVWRERLVDWDDDSGRFRFIAGPDVPQVLPPGISDHPADGAIIELSPAALALTTELADRMAGPGLAALIIDYGHDRRATGETLQAVRDHRPVGCLEDPGSADLTAHVDFAALGQAAAAAGAAVHGPVTQRAFLGALGLAERARALQQASPDQAAAVAAGADRLVDPSPRGMGALFKVMALTHPDIGPAGFAAPTSTPTSTPLTGS